MVRMRWLALALVGCVATAAQAQSTKQDTAKAKVTTTAPKHHTAVSKISHKTTASTSKAEMKAAPATSKVETKAADTAKASSKSTASAKPEAKHMTKHVRKAKVKKDTSSTSKKG